MDAEVRRRRGAECRVSVNLHGTFLVTQRAVPLSKRSEAGSGVTMSSLAGLFGCPNRIAWAITK